MSHEAASPAVVDKPLLRGVLHQVAAVVALVAGTVLAVTSPSHKGTLSAVFFTLSLVTLFTVSATYHRITWSPKARAIMRRADHASIFILIAGTYTPIAIAALPEGTGQHILLVVWCGATVGVLQSLFWIHAPKAVAAIIAVALGWVVVIYWKEATAALVPLELGCVFAGGVAYTIGALAYAFKRPVLWPKWFGYHEFFHAFTLVGATLHFVGIASMIGRSVD
jgi:hemolysin III